jgi:hypothetical protein
MRFFVPTANDPIEARRMYDRLRERIRAAGSDLTEKGIYKIRWRREDRTVNLAVGDSFREYGSDPIMAIFQEPSSYLVCTMRHGAMDGEPLRIESDAVTAVEEFDN